jgi:hypothetical protein
MFGKKQLFLWAITLLVFSACSDKKLHKKQVNKMIDQIEYTFKDASKPPQYHRSYLITVTQQTAGLIIDSYGEQLYEEQLQLDSSQYKQLIATIHKSKLHLVKEEDSQGCTGGTSDILQLKTKDSLFFSGYAYNCGGKTSGTLSGDYPSVIDSIKSIFPALNKKIQQTLK